MKIKCLEICVLVLSIAVTLFAEQSDRPSDKEIRLYMHNKISDEEQIRIGRWMMKNGIEVLPLLLEIEEKSDNTFIGSGVMRIIEKSVSKENAQSVIDRLLQPDTSNAMKTTALEIAEKFGFKGEGYRSVLLEVLSTTEYGGLQKTLLELLRTYGREEDAELVMDVFKKTDNRHIKQAASDTLLAVGGPEIIGPWEEELARLREAEPERLRKQKEKIERLSEQEGITFGPMPEGPSWLDYMEKDLQSLKEKVTTEEAGYSQGGNPKSSLPGGDGEYDEDQASAIHGQSSDESKSARSWPSFPIVLAGMIALAALIVLARKRKA